MLNEVDTDGNGSISFDEFLALMARKMRDTDSDEEMVEAFKVFDRDQNGLIQKDELKKVMEILGEQVTNEEIEEMMIIADPDGDNAISYEKFLACFDRLCKSQGDTLIL